MRNISAPGLANLAQRYGGEPLTIIEVDWRTGIAPRFYADRDIDGIPGRLLEVGELDSVINVSDNSSSQSLSVTVDDTDGSIKTIMDSQDIHKRNVRVWQHFAGLDLADKFLLFAGKISSPLNWSERDRTLKFTIISQLEDKEVGFSAEEGQFPYLPADMVGKAWPMIFGKCLDVPALQVNHAVQGTTLEGVGCLAGKAAHLATALFDTGLNTDEGMAVSLIQMSMQMSTIWCAMACTPAGQDKEDYLTQYNDLSKQRAQLVSQANAKILCAQWSREHAVEEAESTGLGANPLRILGGEDFPQNQTITIDIQGALFTGTFSGEYFSIHSREWPDGEDKATKASEKDDTCPYENDAADGPTNFDYRIEVKGCFGTEPDLCRHHGFIVTTSEPGSANSVNDEVLQQFWADAGATVRMHSNEYITYIVSITPGTVLAVKAFKQFIGESRLVDVPSDLYWVEVKNYGTVTATQLVFYKPLSSITDQGWGDDVYVTFESTIGPNIVDILQYLMTNYTDLTWDPVSFAHVRTKLLPFPANFPILDRKNALTVLQEIAFQSRCALWISNGVFYLKYLPEEPAVDNTITVSDIDAENSVEVEFTPTEDLVTKMIVRWRMSWAPGSTDREKDKNEKTMILRHNIARYGTQEEEYDFYIYNQPDIILKCATFWLIRKSHTWKKLSFKTFLHKLNVEPFDCVLFDDIAGGVQKKYVANSPVKAVVEAATFNSDDNAISFTCLVPVRAGTMEAFPLFWPSALSVDHTWPPQEDIDSGDAGGGGIGMGATGELPIGYTDGITTGGTVFVGGPNVVFLAQSDHGDKTPSDIGFSAQTVISSSTYAELKTNGKPSLKLKTAILRPMRKKDLANLFSILTIDIAKTKLVDSRSPDKRHAHLTSVFNGINEESLLTIKTDATFTDGTQEGEFDFKYDGDGSVYGAGTAFLKD